jgi:hypothetical protein
MFVFFRESLFINFIFKLYILKASSEIGYLISLNFVINIIFTLLSIVLISKFCDDF